MTKLTEHDRDVDYDSGPIQEGLQCCFRCLGGSCCNMKHTGPQVKLIGTDQSAGEDVCYLDCLVCPHTVAQSLSLFGGSWCTECSVSLAGQSGEGLA